MLFLPLEYFFHLIGMISNYIRYQIKTDFFNFLRYKNLRSIWIYYVKCFIVVIEQIVLVNDFCLTGSFLFLILYHQLFYHLLPFIISLKNISLSTFLLSLSIPLSSLICFQCFCLSYLFVSDSLSSYNPSTGPLHYLPILQFKIVRLPQNSKTVSTVSGTIQWTTSQNNNR